jgi:tol-pal system protein YbgF
VVRIFCLAIRTFAFSLLVAATGCATDAVSHAELNELVSSVRALRAENSRLDARLEKLEQQATVATTRRTATAAVTVTARPSAEGAAAALDAIPPLAVVKLKPRTQAAPSINTHVDVVEPSVGVVDALKRDDKPDEDDQAMAQASYERGLDALKTGNSEAGATMLLQFVGDWPRHPRADNALYFIGIAQMAEQDFAGAARQFERVLVAYPAGDAVVDSMLKLGECRAHLKQDGLARAAWQKVITNFPGTPAASQAEAKLAALSTSKNQP